MIFKIARGAAAVCLAASSAWADDSPVRSPPAHPCEPWPPCQVIDSGLYPGKPPGGINPKSGASSPDSAESFTYDSNTLAMPRKE